MNKKYEDFPKWMNHPAFFPGVIGDDKHQGQPVRNPPVMAQNPDQEEMFRAEGYQTADVNAPQAFEALKFGSDQAHKEFEEYPKWVNGREVKSAEEEAAAKGEPIPEAKPVTAGVVNGDLSALMAENERLKALVAAEEEKKAAKIASMNKARAARKKAA